MADILLRRAPKRYLGMSRATFELALPWLVIIGAFILWEAAVRLFNIPQFLLPAPSAIFAAAWEWCSSGPPP